MDFYTTYCALLAVAFAWSLALDWRQTLTIFRTPWRWRELNPAIRFLARTCFTPTRGVHFWFTFVLVLTLAIAWWLPQPWGAAVLAISALLETCFVQHNYRLGIQP